MAVQKGKIKSLRHSYPILEGFHRRRLIWKKQCLGAIMLEKDAIISILDILKPESFYKDSHQKIYLQ